MKKLFAGLLAICLALMCGCSAGSQTPVMYVADGAYNLTPQEFIDMMNATMEEQTDDDYLTIPDWEERTASTLSVTLAFGITFSVNDDDKITRISYHWKNTTASANTAVFLVGATVNVLSNDSKDSEEIVAQLDMLDFTKKSYENTYDINGSQFYYLSANYGEHNWFSVTVIDEA